MPIRVICPHCQHEYRVNDLPEGAKLKCSHCGRVFRHEASALDYLAEAEDDLAAAASDAEQAHPSFRRHRAASATRMPARVWMIPVVAVAVILMFVLLWLGMERYKNPPVTVNRAPAEGTGPSAQTPTPTRQQGLRTRTPQPAQTPGPQQQGPPAPPAGDGNLSVSARVVPGALEDTGYVVGSVLNTYDTGLTDLRVEARLLNPEYAIKELPAFEIANIAPNQSVPFSISFAAVPDVETLTVQAWALSTRNTDPNLIAWELPGREVRMSDMQANGSSTWTGRVTNPLERREVRDVTVYLDFYDRQGRHIGSTTGRLRDSDRLSPGRNELFDADFTPPGAATSEMVHTVLARAVARR